MRAFALAIVISLWLSSGKKTLSVNVFLIDINIESAHLSIFLALLIMSSFINFKNYFTMNDFIRIASNRLFKHDASWAITILEDGSNAWSIDLVRQYRFMSSGLAHSIFGISSFFFIVIPFLGLYFFTYYILIDVGSGVVRAEGWRSMNSLLTYAGWSFAAYPILHTILMLLPFSFTKNVDYIRWNFLYPIHKRYNSFPIELDKWLK